MHETTFNPRWTFLVPALSWAILLFYWLGAKSGFVDILLCIGLIGGVISAVHHAEVIAHRVGEPFGTLVLALSVTTIEVALIVSMMLSGGDDVMQLPRDTIFAAIMIILNGIIGVSLVAGALRHKVQTFNVEGMTDALATTALVVTIGLVLPSFTYSTVNGTFTNSQMIFVAIATLLIFAAFTFYQTMGHREYFINDNAEDAQGALPDNKSTFTSLAFLIISLVAVVLSAKGISPTLEALLGKWGAPAATLGIIIAAIVLLPEFSAAAKAAGDNRLQSSLNLAIGSAIASVGLTIPVVAILALYMGWPLELGLGPKELVFLVLSLFLVALSIKTGYTTIQPGIAHLVLFATYLFFSFVP